jgi:hypothetical protein
MSRQDKATTEKFTKTLRDLVKRQDNKVCADCKRNGESCFNIYIGINHSNNRRSTMGLMEYVCSLSLTLTQFLTLVQWCLLVYPLFGYPSWYGHSYQQGQVCRLGRLDSRADGGTIPYLVFHVIYLSLYFD